jgi:hypothetical protein
MMRRGLTLAAVLLLVASADLRAGSVANTPLQILGEVSTAAAPVDNALIIAFGLSTQQTVQTRTDTTGFFQLLKLPIGVYRIIAVKQGFLPAVATVIPTGAAQRVNLRMRKGKSADGGDQIWEIRRSLPADVLRELDAVLAPDEEQASSTPRLQGQMVSLTGFSGQEQNSSYAQTALELNGRLPSGWTVNVAGKMHQVENSAMEEFAGRFGESAGIVMALETSPRESVRIASARSWWNDEGSRDADTIDLQSHSIEWNRTDSNVELRYLSQQNLFRTSSFNSQALELSGMKRLYASDRTEVGVNVRLLQETSGMDASATPAYRSLDVATRGRVDVGSRVSMLYGLNSRVGRDSEQWSPEAGAELRVTRNVAFVVSGVYKVSSDSAVPQAARFLPYEESGSVQPRYRYALGVVNKAADGTGVTAMMTVAAIDSVVSLLFDDFASPVWEGYYLQSGDIHQDVTLTYRGKIGSRLIFDVSTKAGRTTNEDDSLGDRSYFTGNVRSVFRPSGTSLDVTYRRIDQPHTDISILEASGEHLNLRVGQSLHLPLDLKLLVGVDLARDAAEATGPSSDRYGEMQKRLVGGLSFAF